ncbi:protein bunched, class 2/F/G isoform-like [Anoplophora glabripennis]|uniref:protein bunched, class 2/F/G isoform-like n=1 Tax=Anoplophora glabripennis TaxID=217634 RepID=UPI000874BB35|nr:protein bunched, class 2/F/G isoform-like [Anoplophora glabripennis]
MNADPRRPEKVQRYVPKTNNGNGQEDLTPDYMNILGQHQTTANVAEAADKHAESSVSIEPNLQASCPLEEAQPVTDELAATTNATNATNVIPTSPQYGIAIMSNPPVMPTTNDIPTETLTPSTETITDTTAKPSDESKELHSTPSRNDRFKVVKIASLEPFKRGRWKCMDYVDEAPPAGTVRMPQSTGSIQMAGGQYLQTQSLPQQQIQQMLLQSGFANGTQFFQNMQPQMIPQGQYFYPQVANMPNQTLPQQVSSSMPAQFIGNQPYFQAGVVQNAAGFTMQQAYPNVQYVPANLIQNQNSAFVPTSQTLQMPANFQQSQTYAGQPNVSQSNIAQPLVNGHNFTPQTEQQVTGSLPTQSAKSVILNTNVPQPVVSQTQLTQQNIQNHIPVQGNQSLSVMQAQQFQQAYQQPVAAQLPQSQNSNQVAQNVQTQPGPQVVQVQSQPFDQSLPSNIYTNPQFPMNVNSLTVLDNNENSGEVNETNSGVDTMSESADDLAKTNPVVNAIDNKIEQAMDLVKSHLMYTVREEVEVLKEKIAELMERIQQLETENNYLRSQIPKSQSVAPPATSNSMNNPTTQTSAIPTNPSPNYIPSSNANTVSTPQSSTPVTNPSHNPIPNTQGHSMPPGEAINPPQQQ